MVFLLRTPLRRLRPKNRAAAATFLALGVAVWATLAYAAETQIFDPKTRKWVKYDRKKARSYYAAHKQVPEAFRLQVVNFKTAEKPGTIIIDGNQHFLYLVQPGFTAIRYGIGVGREGFGWAGIVRVGRTAEWPTWTPPAEMVARDPNAGEMGGRPAGRAGQSARRAGPVPLPGRPGHDLPHSWHARALDDRTRRFVGMHTDEQRRHHRPSLPDQCRGEGRRADARCFALQGSLTANEQIRCPGRPCVVSARGKPQTRDDVRGGAGRDPACRLHVEPAGTRQRPQHRSRRLRPICN